MGRTDRGSRSIGAPRKRVYRALTERESLEAWLPPDGMSGRIDRFEPEAGGGYRMVLTYLDPEGSPGKSSDAEDVVEVAFAELVPDERVVTQVAFESEDPAFAGTMTMTWRLAEVPGGTEVTVEAADVPPGISAADHQAGIASSLANLAAHVESGD